MEMAEAEQGQPLAWQRRRGGSRVRVYFCCCPLGLLLAPPLLLARLARGALARGRRIAAERRGGARLAIRALRR